MTFRTVETGVPRRALLLMPLAYFGLDAIFNRKEHPIPDPPASGSKLILPEPEWKRRLTPQEFGITRKGGTEIAYTGRYWNHHEKGVYRCACCGAILFRSTKSSTPVPVGRVSSRPPQSMPCTHDPTIRCWNIALKYCAPGAMLT